MGSTHTGSSVLGDLKWGVALLPLSRAGGDHLSMSDEWLGWPVRHKVTTFRSSWIKPVHSWGEKSRQLTHRGMGSA